MKKCFLILFIMCGINALAQDVIVKLDGSTIKSKVLEVGTSEVKYKKYSNQNGPTYTIPISELFSINYENGEIDNFRNISAQGEEKVNVVSDPSPKGTSQVLIKKPADINNADVISRHNMIYPNISGKPISDKAHKYCTLKYGVTSSSIMSNEDAEVSFMRESVKECDVPIYFIKIKNKTDKVIYIDKGNCFKVYSDGYAECYFDASKQTTVNHGGGSGVSVNLGSVAGALGIGGVAGLVAGGINVGGGTSSSISTTYVAQRIIAIPPHGYKNLSVGSFYSFSFSGGRRNGLGNEHDCKGYEFNSITDLGLRVGVIRKRQTKTFGENELTWKREYYITYSTDENFGTYSVLNAKLYIQEIIGESHFDGFSWTPGYYTHGAEGWYLNENTIVGYCRLDKE